VELTVLENTVGLTPPAAAQNALPGRQVTYTLVLANQGEVAATIDLVMEGAAWPTVLSQDSAYLEAGASLTFTVEVSVPPGAALGTLDEVVITAALRSDHTQTASSTLTTTAGYYHLYLPTIFH
jgi:hypothetical protein